MTKPIDILFTRKLDDEAINLALGQGIKPLIKPMIKIEFPFTHKELQLKMETIEADAWIFTSKNGVRALQAPAANGWKVPKDKLVYAVGEKTAEPLMELGFNPEVSDDHNAVGLAKYIVNNFQGKSLLFLCGDKRRNELPGALRAAKIPLHELFVYQTILTPVKVGETVQGVAFYSPSAVDSYFQENKDREGMVYFTMGNTTEKVLRRHVKNKVVVSDKPSTEQLISTIKSYFSA